MSFSWKLMQIYFNYAYNPVYDFTTGRLSPYHRLQERCVGKLEFRDYDKVLCVGVGTGNEVLHILGMNGNVHIVGIDCSHNALQKAHKKALAVGKEIKSLVMDAQCLEFAAGSFDRVLCIHVMDFLEKRERATSEILRVLKDQGQFVITYPSDKEGLRLGANLLRDSIRHGIDSGRHPVIAFLESLLQMLAGVVYLPLLFRPKRKSYSRRELEAVIRQSDNIDFQIEEDAIYQDFIVYGRKVTQGGQSNAF